MSIPFKCKFKTESNSNSIASSTLIKTISIPSQSNLNDDVPLNAQFNVRFELQFDSIQLEIARIEFEFVYEFELECWI